MALLYGETANKKEVTFTYSDCTKDLNTLSNATKLDDGACFRKDFFAKRTNYRLLTRDHLKVEKETKISEFCFASDVEQKYVLEID